MTLDTISANRIDYTNIDEVCGYQMLLCALYENEASHIYPSKFSPTLRKIECEGLETIREIQSIIESLINGSELPTVDTKAGDGNADRSVRLGDMPRNNDRSVSLGDIPRLLQAYDLLYRICHGHPDYGYLRKVRLRTADRWLRGDKSIPKTDVVLLLLAEVDRDPRAVDERYANYALGVLSDWIDELSVHGTFTGIPMSETYRRLTYILTTDLRPFLGRSEQKICKARWAKAYLLPESEIDLLDTPALRSYAAFASAIPTTLQPTH